MGSKGLRKAINVGVGRSQAGELVKEPPASLGTKGRNQPFSKRELNREEAVARLARAVEVGWEYSRKPMSLDDEEPLPRKAAETVFSRLKNADGRVAEIDLEQYILDQFTKILDAAFRRINMVAEKAEALSMHFFGEMERLVPFAAEAGIVIEDRIAAAMELFEGTLFSRITEGGPGSAGMSDARFRRDVSAVLKYSYLLLTRKLFGNIRNPGNVLEKVMEVSVSRLEDIASRGKGEEEADYYLKLMRVVVDRLALIAEIMERSKRTGTEINRNTVGFETFCTKRTSSTGEMQRIWQSPGMGEEPVAIVKVIERLAAQELESFRRLNEDALAVQKEIIVCRDRSQPQDFYLEKLERLDSINLRLGELLADMDGKLLRKIGRVGLTHYRGIFEREATGIATLIEQNTAICRYYAGN